MISDRLSLDMDGDKVELALGLLLVEKERRRQSKSIQRSRTKWVKSWLVRRHANGAVPNPRQELEQNRKPAFKQYGGNTLTTGTV